MGVVNVICDELIGWGDVSALVMFGIWGSVGIGLAFRDCYLCVWCFVCMTPG